MFLVFHGPVPRSPLMGVKNADELKDHGQSEGLGDEEISDKQN